MPFNVIAAIIFSLISDSTWHVALIRLFSDTLVNYNFRGKTGYKTIGRLTPKFAEPYKKKPTHVLPQICGLQEFNQMGKSAILLTQLLNYLHRCRATQRVLIVRYIFPAWIGGRYIFGQVFGNLNNQIIEIGGRKWAWIGHQLIDNVRAFRCVFLQMVDECGLYLANAVLDLLQIIRINVVNGEICNRIVVKCLAGDVEVGRFGDDWIIHAIGVINIGDCNADETI